MNYTVALCVSVICVCMYMYACVCISDVDKGQHPVSSSIALSHLIFEAECLMEPGAQEFA